MKAMSRELNEWSSRILSVRLEKTIEILLARGPRDHAVPGLINFQRAFRLSSYIWRNSVCVRARGKSIPNTHPKGPLILVALSRFYLDRISHIGVCRTPSVSTRTRPRTTVQFVQRDGDTRNMLRRAHICTRISVPPPTHRSHTLSRGSSGWQMAL